ncbi:hypothetical protein KMP13_15050 [Epibacterium ulvae]|uniref:hypothetical protein n=1 Tax=Epibacterium ulvae TaxID=1156985 RepID=UPI001BFC0D0D|nr:hypothetical protein [Epibacterium ulvae]MBT8155164.1 hypothetical protein [Epibacterium ulvae]
MQEPSTQDTQRFKATRPDAASRPNGSEAQIAPFAMFCVRTKAAFSQPVKMPLQQLALPTIATTARFQY